eukprot:EG_transcript_26165
MTHPEPAQVASDLMPTLWQAAQQRHQLALQTPSLAAPIDPPRQPSGPRIVTLRDVAPATSPPPILPPVHDPSKDTPAPYAEVHLDILQRAYAILDDVHDLVVEDRDHYLELRGTGSGPRWGAVQRVTVERQRRANYTVQFWSLPQPGADLQMPTLLHFLSLVPSLLYLDQARHTVHFGGVLGRPAVLQLRFRRSDEAAKFLAFWVARCRLCTWDTATLRPIPLLTAPDADVARDPSLPLAEAATPGAATAAP